MPESRTVTGSRDDLVVDASRCLRMRFNGSGCRRCVDICPHGAVTLDCGLTVNRESCRACLLCTSECPAGALEQAGDFLACLANLSKVSEPVLGCVRTKGCSNATLACLGGLSEEHLLALCHSLAGRLTLNLSLCGDCPNYPMIAKLRLQMDTLSASGLACGSCCLDIAESAQDLHYLDESIDRRSFFKTFRRSLFTSAAVILSASNEQTERRTDYAGKRVPVRRELLNRTRDKLPPELSALTRKHFDSSISFDEGCTTCQGCVAICPTGALKTDLPDTPPIFDLLFCTGCGLCREFCMDGALRISREKPWSGSHHPPD